MAAKPLWDGEHRYDTQTGTLQTPNALPSERENKKKECALVNGLEFRQRGRMSDSSESQMGSSHAQAEFPSTHWSVVLNAGRSDSPQAAQALETLCRTYWYPLYAYVRRKGYDVPDAQDLTQEFFARLLAKNYLSVADRNRGKFRSFLLGSLEHFLAREWTKAMRKNAVEAKPSFPSMRWMLKIAIFWNRPTS